MFGIGFSELVIILIALFIFVGPKRMADTAYHIGTWIQKIRGQLKHLKETELSEFDTSTFYEPKVKFEEASSSQSESKS